MSLATVSQQSLISLSSIMNDPQSIFIIPTFQRPFAWEKDQLQDLHEDIKNTMQILTSAPNNIHYLAPIHLILFKASDMDNSMLKSYLPNNGDIKNLQKSLNGSGNEFINDVDEPLKVYFVIDGQQRLTTLFFVYHFIYTSPVSKSNPLYVNLQYGNVIPRLIQNSSDDHNYFITLLNNLNSLITLPQSNTQAQKRMYRAVEFIATWNDWNATASTDFTKFLRSSALKTLMIELEPNYGLTSFQILNDRGKSLTALEKFKSLLFEYALNYNSGNLTRSIHKIFSKLYQLLDEGSDSGLFPEGKAGDDRLMQYMLTYMRINQHADNYWQSGDHAYDIFRKELISTTDKSTLLTSWLDEIQIIYDQLKHLNDCMSGKEATVNNPSFICLGRTIRDDYDIIIRSLGLSSRSIAVLLKFRALYKAEWHDRFPMQCICNPDLFKSLSDHLNQIRGKTKNQEIHTQIDLVDMPSCDQKPPYQCNYSMLQVVERMELLIWKRGYNPQGKFKDKWNAVFGNGDFFAQDAVTAWYSWYYPENDFPRFIQDDGNESIFRYILREYEGYLNKGVNIHFDTDLSLEHIFPQTPNPKPTVGYGFATSNDYDQFLNRSGNLTFVYQNASLSNQLPDIKASLYLNPINVKGVTKKQPEITTRVGNQLHSLITDYPAYQDALRVRCSELAVFSLKRFFC